MSTSKQQKIQQLPSFTKILVTCSVCGPWAVILQFTVMHRESIRQHTGLFHSLNNIVKTLN